MKVNQWLTASAFATRRFATERGSNSRHGFQTRPVDFAPSNNNLDAFFVHFITNTMADTADLDAQIAALQAKKRAIVERQAIVAREQQRKAAEVLVANTPTKGMLTLLTRVHETAALTFCSHAEACPTSRASRPAQLWSAATWAQPSSPLRATCPAARVCSSSARLVPL